MARPKRFALAIELTSYCNQHCGYCYNGWREDGGSSVGALPSETLLGLVDKALREVEFDHVTLTGGEPFARHDVFDVLEVCRRHGTRVQIISNGGVITDAIAARLAPYRPLFVQVTLNGPTRELHEEHVGAGHYDKTLRGIDALQAHKVRVAGCIVITRKNAHVVGEVLAQFRERGIKSVALSRFSPAGYAAGQVAELLPSRSDMLVALEQSEAAAREHGMSLQVTMPMPPCVIDQANYPHLRFGGCPIGTEMQEFALGPQGELRNCTLHADPIGDGATQSFADLVQAPAVMHYRDVTPAFCAPCPHRRSCIGGCGGAAASTLGDPRGLDPFVAQHVDDAFRASLRAARAGGFVPLGALRRGTSDA
jgi:radical SAM protein with 4Fe4S-binding SPASM domain